MTMETPIFPLVTTIFPLLTITGWWFWLPFFEFSHKLGGGLEHVWHFPINIGLLIIPIDEVIFFRGVAKNHQPEYLGCYDSVYLPMDLGSLEKLAAWHTSVSETMTVSAGL